MSDEEIAGGENGGVDPSRFRQRFREDVAADYDKIRAHLLSALEAEKDIPAQCPHCERHIKVKVKDYGSGNKAAELYMAAGFGRPESESKVSPEEQASLDAHKMSNEELTERRMTWLVQRVNDGGPELRAELREKWAPILLEALEAA